MTRSIGIGVVGMGWMGEAHSRAYNQLADRFHDAMKKKKAEKHG